jgi:hypothetical protein
MANTDEMGSCAPAVTTIVASSLAPGLLLVGSGAQAHCDSVAGPVAKAVLQALEDRNIHPVLANAPASAEAELQGETRRTPSSSFWITSASTGCRWHAAPPGRSQLCKRYGILLAALGSFCWSRPPTCARVTSPKWVLCIPS